MAGHSESRIKRQRLLADMAREGVHSSKWSRYTTSRKSMHNMVSQLRAQGHEIESTPGEMGPRGIAFVTYRLRSPYCCAVCGEVVR